MLFGVRHSFQKKSLLSLSLSHSLHMMESETVKSNCRDDVIMILILPLSVVCVPLFHRKGIKDRDGHKVKILDDDDICVI